MAGSWLNFSNSRAARWGRRLIAESRRAITPAPIKPNPARWRDDAITMAWLGHSTVLINFFGVRILTDPVLGSRVGISTGLGTIGLKRLVAPALSFKELPPIDVVLLSHAHYDHFDTATLSKLPRHTWIATAADTSDILGSGFDHANELKWGQSALFRGPQGGLEVEAIEVKHWGQRWPSRKPRGYNGYILRRDGKALLFGGDTARTPAFSALRSKGPFAAAIMPIGAYRPWIWNHCSPEESLEMANMAGARYIVPVHHQTFKLSDEPALEPIQRLNKALAREPERLALHEIGETFVLPAT